MADRGLLPRIRPVQLGKVPGRPAIRPVKPAPPPSPPRRAPAEPVKPRLELAPVSELDVEPDPDVDFEMGFDGRPEPVTAIAPYAEPPTNRQAPTRHQLMASVPGAFEGFDGDETLARPEEEEESIEPLDGDATLARFDGDETRARPHENETQARPIDEYLLQAIKPEVTGGDLAIPYDSLPSLEVRRPFDTYDAEFVERDPVTQLVVHESVRLRRAREAQKEDGSGPRERPEPRKPPALPTITKIHQSPPPRPAPSAPPPAPRAALSAPPPPSPPVPPPRERAASGMPGAFVLGVQPIRAADHAAPAMEPHVVPHHPSTAQAFAPQAPMPVMPAPVPMAHYPNMGAYPHAAVAAVQGMAHPHYPTVPPVAYSARSQIKIGRQAWFVAGAGFGLVLALLATGLARRPAHEHEADGNLAGSTASTAVAAHGALPTQPAQPLPLPMQPLATQVAPTQAPPPAMAVPAATPIAQLPAAAATVPAAAVPTVNATALPSVAPNRDVRSASLAPPAVRGVARRPAPPPSAPAQPPATNMPKSMGNGVDAPDPPNNGDALGSLLGDALKN